MDFGINKMECMFVVEFDFDIVGSVAQQQLVGHERFIRIVNDLEDTAISRS